MTESNSDTSTHSGGLLTAGGVRLSLTNLSFTIGGDGSFHSDVKVEISIDVTPYWLEIAAAEAQTAIRHHAQLLDAWKLGDQGAALAQMDLECKAAMQAFVATGVALDALYSVVREDIDIPAEVLSAWRQNRTARFRQVAEVFGRAFAIHQSEMEAFRATIKEIYKWRDFTVHPPAESRAPVHYPALGVSTEWRFVTFQAANAVVAVGGTLGLIESLLRSPRLPHIPFRERCALSHARVLAVVTSWRRSQEE